jgi:uncharacterized phage protein gp47/JayE
VEDIFKKLKVDYEFVTGWIYKGLASALGAGFASRLKEFTDKLNFIKKQAFVATADKDYLYLNASELLPPKPAEIANGLVVFYGENGSVVPADTEIKDDNGVFKVISDATIAQTILNGTATVADGIATMIISNQLTSTTALVNDTSKQITIIDGDTIQFEAGTLQTGGAVEIKVNNAPASVVAGEAGIVGNRDLNDVLKLKITIAGVNTELGALQISGGVDDEDVEVYRQRVIYFKSNPQAPFSKQNIVATNKERLKTIKYVWVKNNDDDVTIEDGEIRVIALNDDLGLTAYEIDEITKNTKAIAPANFASTGITTTSATVIGVDIVIQDLTPSSDGLKNEVKKNIEYFFDNDMYEIAVTQQNLEAIIYKTTNGAETVASFTLVGGWQVATDNTFWKLDNVIFQ